jgi:aspartate aminotransferase
LWPPCAAAHISAVRHHAHAWSAVDFSSNVREIQPSATLAVAALARELRAAGRDILDLCAGEPDFDTPGFVAEAGIRAIRAGQTRYTPAAGLPALRAAIADDLARTAARPVDPASIVVSSGAKQALFNACFALFGPGDRVLLPAPYWTSYPPLIGLAGAEPVEVPTTPEQGYRVSIGQLERLADERTRGLIINSPGNPTGAVYPLRELAAITAWASERGIWVISDEIYGRICFTAERAPGLLNLPEERLQRGVLVDGASKTFAMTGWRIGFTCSPVALADVMAALQSHVTSNAATPSQLAALAAYRANDGERQQLRELTETFRQRRDALVELFRRELPDVTFTPPDGAFYIFFPYAAIDPAARSSVEFCNRALEEVGVALVPGSAFGADDMVRMSFAASEDVLSEGVRRLAQLREAATERRAAGD